MHIQTQTLFSSVSVVFFHPPPILGSRILHGSCIGLQARDPESYLATRSCLSSAMMSIIGCFNDSLQEWFSYVVFIRRSLTYNSSVPPVIRCTHERPTLSPNNSNGSEEHFQSPSSSEVEVFLTPISYHLKEIKVAIIKKLIPSFIFNFGH